MPWIIERKHDHVAVVTMNTNKVNAQNPAFFSDLHAAFDRLETEFDDCAVVLAGAGKVFSAGLDLDHHFAMYARRNLKEIDDWFAAYRATNLRLFTYPRPTVAAINGHAYAGGFITAIDCDYRIAAGGALQFALNECRSEFRCQRFIARSSNMRSARRPRPSSRSSDRFTI
jgi:enoyl-CoA hydratase